MIGGRERANHIDIRKLFAHEAAKHGYLHVKRVSTTDQLADVFTKCRTHSPSLHPKQHAACISRLLRQTWPDSKGTSILMRENFA